MNPNVAAIHKVLSNSMMTDTHAFPSKPLCLHCKSPVPAGIQTDIRNPSQALPQSFCCSGCSFAYRFINEQNLGKYYETLEICGAAGTRISSEDLSTSEKIKPELIKHLFETEPGIYTFFVPSLRCAACDWLLKRSLGAIANTGQVEVNIALLQVKITFYSLSEDASNQLLETVMRTMTSLGYRPFPLESENNEALAVQSQKKIWRNVAIAAVCFGNTMSFSAAVYFGERVGIDGSFEKFFAWISLALTLPCVLIAGQSFFIEGFRIFRFKSPRFAPSIDLPIALALLAGLVLSTYSTFTGNTREVYFDSLCGLIFFLLLGRAIQSSLLHRLQRKIARGEDLLPLGSFTLKAGDRVIVARGENFPADGLLDSDVAEVNEALLTGESTPILKKQGDSIAAGSQNLSHAVHLLVQKVGYETRAGRLITTAREALAKATRLQGIAQKSAPWFIFFVLGVGLSVFVFYAASGDFYEACQRSLAVFVVGCPCAFGLGVPLAFARASSFCWKAGGIIQNMQGLESLAKCTVFYFDKTGTLTLGQPECTQMQVLVLDSPENASRVATQPTAIDPEIKHILMNMTHQSSHPASRAVFHFLSTCAERRLEPNFADSSFANSRLHTPQHSAHTDVSRDLQTLEMPGLGIECQSTNQDPSQPSLLARLGKLEFVSELLTESSKTKLKELVENQKLSVESFNSARSTCFFSFKVISNKACATAFESPEQKNFSSVILFELTDSLRPEAPELISSLVAAQKKVFILSGDRLDSVQGVANLIGLNPSQCLANQSPEEKLAAIVSSQKAGEKVAFLGDGINDAPALATADVGIAFTSGSNLAQKSASLSIVKTSMQSVQSILNISNRLQLSLKLMFSSAVVLNACTISFAALGHITPLGAAILMPASSLLMISFSRVIYFPQTN